MGVLVSVVLVVVSDGQRGTEQVAAFVLLLLVAGQIPSTSVMAAVILSDGCRVSIHRSVIIAVVADDMMTAANLLSVLRPPSVHVALGGGELGAQRVVHVVVGVAVVVVKLSTTTAAAVTHQPVVVVVSPVPVVLVVAVAATVEHHTTASDTTPITTTTPTTAVSAAAAGGGAAVPVAVLGVMVLVVPVSSLSGRHDLPQPLGLADLQDEPHVEVDERRAGDEVEEDRPQQPPSGACRLRRLRGAVVGGGEPEHDVTGAGTRDVIDLLLQVVGGGGHQAGQEHQHQADAGTPVGGREGGRGYLVII